MAKSARARSTCAAGALSERLRRVSSWRSSAVSGRRGSCWWRDMAHLGARGSPHHYTSSHGRRPTSGGGGLMNGGRVVRFGRWGVVGKYGHRPRLDDQVSDQALVRGIIAQNPAATVEEHENRQVALSAGRPHDVKLQRFTVMVDRLLRPLNTRQIDLHALLRIDQDLTRVLGRKLLDRCTAARVQ